MTIEMTAEGSIPDRPTHTRKEPSVSTDTVAAYSRQVRIDGLRRLADWLEANPETKVPLIDTIHEAACTQEHLISRCRALGGRWKKVEDDQWFGLRQEVAPGVNYELFVHREEVCERVVVGVEKREVEGPDPELVAQLPTTKRTETVEKVEWKCPESLLALDTSEEPSASERMDRIGVPEVVS